MHDGSNFINGDGTMLLIVVLQKKEWRREKHEAPGNRDPLDS